MTDQYSASNPERASVQAPCPQLGPTKPLARNARRPYQPPELKVYGSVEVLTQLGGTRGNEGQGDFAFRES